MQKTIELGPFVQIIIHFMLIMIMLVVALEVNWIELKNIRYKIKPYLWGIIAKLLVAPATTFFFAQFMGYSPEVKIALLLLAATPVGNISNYLTHMAKGDVILSVSLSFSSTLMAPLFTPLIFAFWVHQSLDTAQLFKQVSIDTVSLLISITITLIIPMLVGGFLSWNSPLLAQKIKKKVGWIGPTILLVFFIFGVITNFKLVQLHFWEAFVPVMLLNAILMMIFFFTTFWLFRHKSYAKAITMEMGIHNAALTLLIALQFFPQIIAVSMVASLWGLWHLVTGIGLAKYWQRQQI